MTKPSADQVDWEMKWVRAEERCDRFLKHYEKAEERIKQLEQHIAKLNDRDFAQEVYSLEGENELLKQKNARLREAAVKAIENIQLRICGWELNEDIMEFNGKPIGATISRGRMDFDRWWPALQRNIIQELKQALERNDEQAS